MLSWGYLARRLRTLYRFEGDSRIHAEGSILLLRERVSLFVNHRPRFIEIKKKQVPTNVSTYTH
jgi:hypothetical protein